MYIQDGSLSTITSVFSCNNEFIQIFFVKVSKYYKLKEYNIVINL